MKESNYRNSNSFIGKTPVILVLLGIIPFLLVIYLFIYEELNITNMVVLLSALALFSVLAGYSLMRRSADQLVTLAKETRNLGAGGRMNPIKINADQELNDIADNFNSMFEKMSEVNKEIKEQSVQLMIYGKDLALSYQRAKEEESLRAKLSRYVGETLVEKLVNSQDGLFFENERRKITILFADIRFFSSLSERMEAEEVVTMLNQFFGVMVDIVFRNNGILDKFIGDALMAVFGVISADNNGAPQAIRAAIEMQNKMENLNQKRKKEGLETFEIGVGINTGHAIVGNVGSVNRMDYTVIGDSVNIASRLENIAKSGEIIIGEETYLQSKGLFHTEERGPVQVRNKLEPVVCYQVLRQ